MDTRISTTVAALVLSFGAAFGAEDPTRVAERLLAPPKLAADPGFSVKLLVPPGKLWDPLFMRVHGKEVWLTDDGGEEGEKGSRILSLAPSGKLAPVVGLGRVRPTIAFDFAPKSFTGHEGGIFSLAQAKVAMEGALANHVIEQIDPERKEVGEKFCDLEGIPGDKRASGLGIEARFGPEGSPFAGRFFAITALNDTIYQATPDRACRPFVTFDGKPWQVPTGISFSKGGKEMLVAVSKVPLIGEQPKGAGAIVRVSSEGEVLQPLVEGLVRPFSMGWAPQEFGKYGGELFFVDLGDIQAPVPMTQPLRPDGAVYRLDSAGEVHRVASGFVNPVALHFQQGRLWVSDINGDFIAGKRELPDGFVAEIQAR